MFGYEITDNKTAIHYTEESEAIAAMDFFNVDILLDVITGFILKHGGEYNKHFKGKALLATYSSKTELQRFVTGCNTLRRKRKASGAFVWELVNELVIHSIGLLKSDKTAFKTYNEDYNNMCSIVNAFYTMYAPPISTEAANEYLNTPAMREFYAR